MGIKVQDLSDYFILGHTRCMIFTFFFITLCLSLSVSLPLCHSLTHSLSLSLSLSLTLPCSSFLYLSLSLAPTVLFSSLLTFLIAPIALAVPHFFYHSLFLSLSKISTFFVFVILLYQTLSPSLSLYFPHLCVFPSHTLSFSFSLSAPLLIFTSLSVSHCIFTPIYLCIYLFIYIYLSLLYFFSFASLSPFLTLNLCISHLPFRLFFSFCDHSRDINFFFSPSSILELHRFPSFLLFYLFTYLFTKFFIFITFFIGRLLWSMRVCSSITISRFSSHS